MHHILHAWDCQVPHTKQRNWRGSMAREMLGVDQYISQEPMLYSLLMLFCLIWIDVSTMQVYTYCNCHDLDIIFGRYVYNSVVPYLMFLVCSL